MRLSDILQFQDSSASKLIAKLVHAGILEPVSGYGKGRYRLSRE